MNPAPPNINSSTKSIDLMQNTRPLFNNVADIQRPLFSKSLDPPLLIIGDNVPPGKYMFVEYSFDIPMIYSQNIRKKFPMKFRGIFPNNVPGILNIGIFPDCPMNILRMLIRLFPIFAQYLWKSDSKSLWKSSKYVTIANNCKQLIITVITKF